MNGIILRYRSVSWPSYTLESKHTAKRLRRRSVSWPSYTLESKHTAKRLRRPQD